MNVKIINTATHKKVVTLKTPTGRGVHVLGALFLPDSQYILTARERTYNTRYFVCK
ncbi:MAG: hypothetical protein ACRBFS_24000 [Aureispira sp.]